MKSFNFPAFTLVELIVVITIIGILSTVWFVSYSNYLTWARDSNRYSQLTKLSDSLQVYATSKSLPLPDDYIEITASWASNVIAYQWYVWTDVLETIDYTNWGKDPKDDSFYTYYLTKDRKSLQLMALMEEAGSVALNNAITNTTFAVDYSSRFPKVYGRKLWVLTEVDTNTPVQEVSSILTGSGYLDIAKTMNIYNSFISNEEILSGTWKVLREVPVNASCKRIKQTWDSYGNDFYDINFAWDIRNIYCYMDNGEAIEDMLEWEWDFKNGNWISTLKWENPTNSIQVLVTPISSNFGIHQTWSYSSQYVIDFKDPTLCKIWDTIYMSAWVRNEDWGIFHSRIYENGIQVMYIDVHPNDRKIIETRTIGNDTWNKYIFEKPVTATFDKLRWFIGYGAQWTNWWPSITDFYFTWIRLSCHP